MAMTEQERKELKEGMKKRLEERKRENKNDGCLKLLIIPVFIIAAYFLWSSREDPSNDSNQNPAPVSNQSQYIPPKNNGMSADEAKKQIEYVIAHTGTFPYDVGSLRRMRSSNFSSRGGERSNVRKYNDKWVAMSNEVAVKVLTSGICQKLNSVQVMTLTKTPLNPEMEVDCDGRAFKGFYSNIMEGRLTSALDFDEQQADAYYARAPKEYDSTHACYTEVQNMAKDPDSIDYYPATAQSGTRPGKDGPEFFLNEDFTAKNGFGANVRNTFYCTVSSSGETTVKFKHR